VRDWLGESPPVDRDRALAELARRYLTGHGPADDRDLARWAGLPLRAARTGLRAIAPELVEREDGLVDLARRAPAAGLPPPRLLGSFDPLLLGWSSRAPILGSNAGLVAVGGLFRPFALAGGRAIATWRLTNGAVALEPFAPLQQAESAALAADADDVVRYLDPHAEGGFGR
jgi:winged helix DNA-binding protein